MLVLTRKRNQQIVIGDHVHVTVVDVQGSRVRLGIEAPIEVPVHRKELHEAIKSTEKASRDRPRVCTGSS
jgi:carbon storage regulator